MNAQQRRTIKRALKRQQGLFDRRLETTEDLARCCVNLEYERDAWRERCEALMRLLADHAALAAKPPMLLMTGEQARAAGFEVRP